MRLFENILLALSGLRSSKMRSLLTMLGIIIGIGSVIAITTIGDALTSTFTDSMANMGVNNIEMDLVQRDSGSYTEIDEADKITDQMLEDFEKTFPNEIQAVSVQQGMGGGKVKDGRKYANVAVRGVNEGFKIASNVKLLDGRFVTDRDVKGSKNVAVVSDKLVEKIFGKGSNPLEQEIKVYIGDQIYTFTVVGVFKYESAGMMGGFSGSEEDLTTNLYVPVTTAKRASGAKQGYDWFTVTTNPEGNAEAYQAAFEAHFDKVYKNNPRYRVMGFSMGSMLEEFTKMLSTVKLAIAAIAAISLLVGGIGVMNIMLVSVTERTREIGTRKALGARNSAIRSQFVVEAMIICMIGGLIGVGFGLLLGNVGSKLLGASATADPATILFAVLFSMVIGVFFGYYPANKAAKLDPIEALRYE